MSWYAVRTQSNFEAQTKLHLEEGGAEVYLPRVINARRIVPLFGGYLFVKVFPAWMWIKRTRGVIDVLGSSRSGDPSMISDGEIDRLKEMHDASGFIILPERQKASKFRLGDKVRMASGLFRDFRGLYDGQEPGDRVAVLLDMLGRKVRFVADEGDVVAV